MTDLPISNAAVEALLRRVPFGERMAGGEGDAVSGYHYLLALPGWLNDLLGGALPAATVAELQLIEAHLLVYLQFVDDAIDGQRQIGPGNAALPLQGAEGRLGQLFGAGDPFWEDYQALAAEQAASARWETEGRSAPLPPFDDALFRAVAAKGALLRWPAAAMARLAGQPERVASLDDLVARVLGVVLFLDDLADFEEDAERGQINSVLCAGEVRSHEPLDFYPRALRGSALVCARVRRELEMLRAAAVPSPGLQRACRLLEAQCGSVEAVVSRRCQAGPLRYILEMLCAQ